MKIIKNSKTRNVANLLAKEFKDIFFPNTKFKDKNFIADRDGHYSIDMDNLPTDGNLANKFHFNASKLEIPLELFNGVNKVTVRSKGTNNFIEIYLDEVQGYDQGYIYGVSLDKEIKDSLLKL